MFEVHVSCHPGNVGAQWLRQAIKQVHLRPRRECVHAGEGGGEPDIACRTCLENSLLLSSMAVWTVKPHRMLSDYCQTHLGRYVLAVAV